LQKFQAEPITSDSFVNRYKDTGPLADKIDEHRARKVMQKALHTGMKRAKAKT